MACTPGSADEWVLATGEFGSRESTSCQVLYQPAARHTVTDIVDQQAVGRGRRGRRESQSEPPCCEQLCFVPSDEGVIDGNVGKCYPWGGDPVAV